ncbi:hypothetical protein [Bradyrhizobium sp. 2S1]|uniref:hypothetical protein n=1 Tax=Bradyrhizobium sp. 2S1 TaxID=1404429 RepID=UPI00140CCDC0|nr:hypothetical protein [Bradyrhizobium sp. 2S1]MCK7672357.1 hypothetical protein [Bradyrhizobium sp. 2S1]
MLSLLETDFPASTGFVRAKWAPLLLRPILGSPEQFVIGVGAVNQAGFHLERANSFVRLTCLFAADANSAVLAAQAALDAFEADLSSRAIAALAEYQPVFSGVVLGDVGEAEGPSLQSIAASWMASLSSLYSASPEIALTSEAYVAADVAEPARPRDRLPALILEYVVKRRPGLDQFFSEEIREQHARRRTNISGVHIDFAGSRIVANFGTLSVSHHVASVGRIKQRLWELKVDRDSEKGGLAKRNHEMIVQHPAKTDPQFSEKQIQRIEDALGALREQADQEEIGLRPMHTINEIGDHLLAKEAA